MKKALINVAKDIALNPCNYYLFEKQYVVSFNSFTKRKLELLRLVHSNVCGPMEEESLGGNRYFITFINDISQKV